MNPSTDRPELEMPDDDPKVVAERLRIGRETLGLTQQEVADALSVPRTAVINFEGGKRNVTALELRRLSRLYRRNVAWLVGAEDDAPSSDPALFRATKGLSNNDREQVLRFAQFLANAGEAPRPSND